MTTWQSTLVVTKIQIIGRFFTMEKELFERGCTHFDERQYFDAHEVWEELWNEAQGPRRFFLQGMIQAAVALHHAGNQNWVGTRKLSASALDYFEKGRSEGREIDIDQIKENIIDFELALQKLLLGETIELPFYKLPRK